MVGMDAAELDAQGGGQRLRDLLSIAEEMGSGITVGELVSLLPDAVTDQDVIGWLSSHPEVAQLDGEVALSPRRAPADRAARRERGARYQTIARAFVEGPLAPIHGWIRCIGLTGSAAYGEPEEGDDVDFLVITRSGAVWAVLASIFLLSRFGRKLRNLDGMPELCFNYVLEDARSLEEFARPQGYLFAREALSVRVIRGSDYYESLLGTAPWIRREIPRLYSQRNPTDPRPALIPAPVFVRLANAVLFPLVASYLQMVGLIRNHRFRKAGRPDRAFRTFSTLDRLSYVSARFERLRARYRGTAPTPDRFGLAERNPFGTASAPDGTGSTPGASPSLGTRGIESGASRPQ